MGIVIRFPDEKRLSWNGASASHAGSASVIILPVVRVERHADESTGGVAPEAGTPSGRGRGRPGRRA